MKKLLWIIPFLAMASGTVSADCISDPDPCPGYTAHDNGSGCDTQGPPLWPWCCAYEEYYKNCPSGQKVYRTRSSMAAPSRCNCDPSLANSCSCLAYAPPAGGGG